MAHQFKITGLDSLYCALHLYGLFTTCHKFVSLTTITLIPQSPHPANHHFTLRCVFFLGGGVRGLTFLDSIHKLYHNNTHLFV